MKFKQISRLQNEVHLLKKFTRVTNSTKKFYSSTTKYRDEYEKSIKNPSDYWAEAADKLVWFNKWDKVIDTSHPVFTKWFTGGKINHCYNSIDRHVDEGRGDQVAIIHESPVTNSMTKITYNQLLHDVSRLAGDLAQNGVKTGDRVLIYMPMIPQAIAAMLATVRIGAVHVVVFGGFAAKELSVRIDHCKPTAVISASCGIEPSRKVPYKPILDEALKISKHKPKRVVIYQRPGMDDANLQPGRDISWQQALATARGHDCVPVDSMHPLYVLYTSGTTGTPKGAVRPTGPHCVRLHWSMEAIYDVRPGEVFWAASDLGWTVGHSYICHAPLINGNTSIVFEGKPVGTPDATTFFRVVSDHKVACLFTAPTALRSIKRVDPNAELQEKFDLSSLRTLFVAGEHCDSDTSDWSSRAFKVPVIDHWWQTETGSPITSTCIGLGNPVDPPKGSSGLAVPGWDMRVVDDKGVEVGNGELGNLVAKLPLAPGAFTTLYGDDERYLNTYFKRFKGFYDTMDAGVRDNRGYISVMSRTDDVINVAGHRLSCGHIEEAINLHEDVVECAVVALDDSLKGSVPVAFVVCKPDVENTDGISKALVQLVRQHIGPVAAFRHSIHVNRIPKTRSGKTPRNSLQAMLNKKSFNISPTIEDASVYEELQVPVDNFHSKI